MTSTEWPSDWLRGVLEVAVLRVLADGPSYGYAIAGRLAEAGLGDIKGGTLYPLLARLESAGLVRTQWRAGQAGPGRKFFELTDDGVRRQRELAARWRLFAAHTLTLLDAPLPDPAAAAATTP